MPDKTNFVPVHGNYHGYYSKRPSTHDPRLSLLPSSLFQDKRVLDVGCNEGWVTCEIAQRLGAKRIVGVDIDDALVRLAWKHRRSVWSQQGPPENVSGRTQEGEDPHRPQQGIPDYFPASCEHMFGPLLIPDAVSQDGSFPHNVAFRTADWVHNEIPDDAEGYDVVLAFSISKWIHLNGGDEGLLKFFRRVYQVLGPGGTFVLEAQEWDTYGKAKRMDPVRSSINRISRRPLIAMQKLKENAKTLKLRPDDFERILQDIGFGPAEHLGAVGEGGRPSNGRIDCSLTTRCFYRVQTAGRPIHQDITIDSDSSMSSLYVACV
ncbi:S-adenosyl-L-methionine-dependent methyltransferase [Cubamyces menziesii]|nr:S-adenosyl-L-methionine-dependent methyltransferase [Cubamyces menziesii]